MRVVALINDDAELSRLSAELDQLWARANERLTWLQEQQKKMLNSLSTEKDAIWRQIERRLKDTGKIPADYVAAKSGEALFRSDDCVAIIAQKKQDNPLIELLRGFNA